MENQTKASCGRQMANAVESFLEDVMPEDIFPEELLAEWAQENGYMKSSPTAEPEVG